LDTQKRYRGALQKVGGLRRLTRKVPLLKTPHFELKLSEAALALREVDSLRKMTPQERENRLKEIKTSIHKGTYRVDSFRVAEKILREEEPHLFY
jgi:flagellar biosynthesis anti-sigma factor FlgM